MAEDEPQIPKEAEKLPVVDYDFYLVGREAPLQVTVWPTKGDEVTVVEGEYHFRFPRLKTTQTVERRNIQTTIRVESERVPFTMEEFKRKMEEYKELHGKEAK